MTTKERMRFYKFQKSYQLRHIVDLVVELVRREIKLQYKRSTLGIMWSFVTPLVQLATYFFVFSIAFSIEIPNYAAFIFCGMIVWIWFQMSLYRGAGAITENRDLVRQPGFPVSVLPVIAVITNLVQFLLSLPILLIFLIHTGSWVSPAIVFLPVLILLQFLFTLSLAYLAAAVNVTFRDTQHILNILLNIFFYLTPIFYQVDFIPEKYLFLYNLNPLVSMVESYRAVLIDSSFPPLSPLIAITVFSILLLIFSLRVFENARHSFVEEL